MKKFRVYRKWLRKISNSTEELNAPNFSTLEQAQEAIREIVSFHDPDNILVELRLEVIEEPEWRVVSSY